MKIIKSGNLKEIRPIRRFKCNRCGCIFDAKYGEYTELNLKIIHEGEWIFSCICPCCQEFCITEK